jgi:hypothetical protein
MASVNEVLSLLKVIRERLNELKGLRNQVSVKDKWMRDDSKVTEPQYSVQLVDKKIVMLQNFIFLADSKIKSINAKTEVEGLEVNVSDLLSPLE